MLRRDIAAAAAAAVVGGWSLIGGTPARADAPLRSGWWNTVSVTTVAAPAPTAPSGGLRVAAASGEVTAFGAMLFRTNASGGQVILHVAQALGTAAVQACPASNDSWNAGDDQPSATAPGYDCTTAKFPGKVSPDGGTVTFAVTTFGQPIAGQLDLVVVPPSASDGSPATFQLDIDKPTTTTFAPSETSADPPAPTAFAPSATDAGGRATTAPGGTSGTPGAVTAEPQTEAPPVIAALPPLARAHHVAAVTSVPIHPNKKGIALAAVLLALAAWIRFMPGERS